VVRNSTLLFPDDFNDPGFTSPTVLSFAFGFTTFTNDGLIATFLSDEGLTASFINSPLFFRLDTMARRDRGYTMVENSSNTQVLYVREDARGGLSLRSIPLIGGGDSVRLSDVAILGGPSGRFFVGDDTSDSDFENRSSVQPTNDRINVVYMGAETTGSRDLYSVPIAGGESQKLNRDGDLVSDFQISSNSKQAVYSSDGLYAVPIGGGSEAQRLDTVVPNVRRILGRFSISENSEFVVYLADQDSFEQQELYMVELEQDPEPPIPTDSDELCIPIKAKNDKLAVVCL